MWAPKGFKPSALWQARPALDFHTAAKNWALGKLFGSQRGQMGLKSPGGGRGFVGGRLWDLWGGVGMAGPGWGGVAGLAGL